MSIEALKQALEELQYVLDSSTNEDLPLHGNSFNKTISILEQAIEQAEKQKPVAYMDDKGYICNHTTNPERWTPLYTAPPQREWVGLTDQEILDLADEHLYNGGKARDFIYHAHDIEAKLKEKNHVS